MKYLMNVGAEKAGTTWLWTYFEKHPDFLSLGKELNIIERDSFVPTFTKSHAYQKDINEWFKKVKTLDKPTGDFTHYEGSSENIFRMFKEKLEELDIDVVPVYVMRDPIKRAWSSWNMFCDYVNVYYRPAHKRIDSGKAGFIDKMDGPVDRFDFDLHPISRLFVGSYLNPEYKPTIQCLDNVFDDPMYFFYEELFTQENMNLICKRMDISSFPIDPEPVNKGLCHDPVPAEFIEIFCNTSTYKETVNFINKRFDNVPWNIADYENI